MTALNPVVAAVTARIQERYGVACLRANDLASATAAFVTASKLSPHKAFPYQQLAVVFNRQGRVQDARDASKIAQDIAHDENLLNKQVKVVGDNEKVIEIGRQGREELEAIFQQDQYAAKRS